MAPQALEFLQINLNHCALAQDLLWQFVGERKVDLAIVSEPYAVEGVSGWYTDHTGLAAIGVCPDCPVTPREVERGDGFVAVVLGACTVYSCYISPNCTFEEYIAFLGCLGDSVSRRQGEALIVAGDFNSKSEEWQSGITDRRGHELGEWIDNMQLQVANVGNTPTRFHQGFGSIVDVTFASPRLARRIPDWRVLDNEVSGSDHRYINFSLHREVEVAAPKKQRRWATRKLNEDRLTATFLAMTWGMDEREEEDDNEDAVQTVKKLTRVVTAACDSAMPRSGPPRGRGPIYWWNDEVAQLRKECNHQRRLYERSRGRIAAQMVSEQYQLARKRLKTAIKASKRSAWNELRSLADDDPFGKPYKVIMKKFGGPTAESRMEPEDVVKAIDKLFPRHPPVAASSLTTRVEDVPPISTKEVDAAVERCKMKKWKAPGLDQIPGAVWCAIHEAAPSLLTRVFNKVLRGGVFPERWKKARLALIPKPGQPPDKVRPLCLLDSLNKLFERVVVNRLSDHLERKKVLSNSQYGFRTERCTADAALKLKRIATAAIKKRQFCAAVSLDIQNAFNSIPWPRIIEALEKAKVPVYLQKITRSYLDCRFIEAETSAGTVSRKVTCGVPQGSVYGPPLWNVGFDPILRLKLPAGVQLICYADDTLVVCTGETVAEVESRVNQVLEALTSWIESAKMKLAVEKTEAVLFTRRRKYDLPVFRLGGVEVKIGHCLKYLGIWFDGKLSFREHFRRVADKANRKLGILSALMTNLRGPREVVRQMYANVALSVLLYGAPVWADATKVAYRRREIEKIQRRAALRCVCAYRTVSTEAVCILARTPPIDLLAAERAMVYEASKKARTKSEVLRVKRDARRSTIQQWEDRLSHSATGEWTRTLICNLEQWMNRSHGQMNFHLTQVMSGHGCFNAYLHRMRIKAGPECSHCDYGWNDGPQHTLFECEAWLCEREELVQTLSKLGIQEPLETETLVPIMLRSAEAWKAVSTFASKIMKMKMDAERARQRAEQHSQLATQVPS